MAQACDACRGGVEQPMPFSMAFQPIVDVVSQRVYAYEALVRGPEGEGAASVLSQITPQNLYAFDQTCRRKAITLASQLNLQATGAKLSINFLPGAVYSPAACIQLTLKTAREMNFPLDRLIFELTEREELIDPPHLQAIAAEYQKHGFEIALDDFGAGYANLNLLANLRATVLKLDMDLTRNLHERPRAREVVSSLITLCGNLGMTVVAEGIETLDEYLCLRDLNVTLMQGYLFAKPAFEALPPVQMPKLTPLERPGSAAAPARFSILQGGGPTPNASQEVNRVA